MTKSTRSVLAGVGLSLVTASAVSAQPAAAPRLFISGNVGIHASSNDFEIDDTQIVYAESAIIHSEQTVGGGPMIDISGGYRFTESISLAVGFSRFSDTSQAQVTAAVPHPIFFDRRVESTIIVEDLEHKQRAFHVSVMYTTPVAETVDASVFAGPSFIKVTQDVASGITVPPGTQTFTSLHLEESKNVTGFHIGGDVTFAITPMIGVGGLVRFVIGSADLPSVPDLSVNGFEVGGGLRLRF